ncbi:conserved hypothetical protein [Treponema primitia ZAS-2]|uniref:Aminoglycoside phosphotransferase domain-containing protein n=1 Tax=Treponema primitia (strain ATCC BAA-887 / DSM 12427 / ZAS-2) TaxID=545694 RepID=F5YQA0_TREPZ|nr:phosphotransferase [Treponema primitia]AEF83951.1 conserved hypothetical protein [Treponema primitia ZAS-2]
MIKLNGHSGCIIELININEKNIVIKRSKDISYNKRLEEQCKKQEKYSRNIFSAVRVIDKGADKSGLFWFSMEYINGLTLADYMKTIELQKIKDIAQVFLSLIPSSFDNIEYDANAKKICLLKVKTLSENIIEKSEIIDVVLNKLENYQWNYIQYSKCHGDLTLENIIVSQNNLYLIDFLDSFYNSWQIDIAKVLQDIELFWHYRKEKIDNNLFIRLLVLKEIMLTELLKKNDGEKIVESIYYLLLLNLLRILPYTKDESTYDFLQQSLVSINSKIYHRNWER